MPRTVGPSVMLALSATMILRPERLI